MPSQLQNLTRRVSWQDFKGQVPANATHNAMISVSINFSGVGVRALPGGGVTLQDSLVVAVVLDQNASWARQGASRTADLLRHEQGHYDITALAARDMFIDLMQLKARTFSGAAALQNEITAIRASYPAQTWQTIYDAPAATDHGRNAAGQQRWNTHIQRAFTTPRQPALSAPDGTPYKVRLRDVLSAANAI